MANALKDIYENHHKDLNKSGFSIMKEIRGKLISDYIGEGKDVLDIGCRDGTLTSFFVKNNRVTGADIDLNSLEAAKNKLGIETVFMDLNGDWQELGEKRFDAVVAGEVLEHLYYPDRVVEKIKKLLKPEGIFIGTVPNAFSFKNRIRYLLGQKRFTPLADPTHINQFGLNDLREVLKKNFGSVDITGLGKYARLSKAFPSLVAFILMFICKNK
ncbi:MAG: methyltransferase domain-containing protein [Candidatus Buchananbacteria bacterium]